MNYRRTIRIVGARAVCLEALNDDFRKHRVGLHPGHSPLDDWNILPVNFVVRSLGNSAQTGSLDELG